MNDVAYTLSPRWKEELVCTCAHGSFILQFDMGTPTVYLPEEEKWPRVAPAWAAGHWPALHARLSDWCKSNHAGLVVGGHAPVY